MELLIIHSFSDRMLLLLGAMGLSWLLLGPVSWYRAFGLEKPEGWLTGWIHRLEAKLNRSRRNASTRIYRGMMLVMFFLLMGWLLSLLLHMLERQLQWAVLIEILLVAYLIPSRHVWNISRRVNLLMGDARHIEPLRRLLASFSSRDTHDLDHHAIVRSTIEYLAEQAAAKVVAPALYYLALGLPALVTVRLIHLLAEQIGHRSDRYRMFGWAARHLDALLLCLPSLVAALLLCVATWFVPRCKPFGAVAILFLHPRRIRSLWRRWPLCAMAGALYVCLGGPRRTVQELIRDEWVGTGSAKATTPDLARAQWLYLVSQVILLVLIGSALLVQQSVPIDELLQQLYERLLWLAD